MQKTIISHFYNEETLLPWWLEHHKQIFDHGILIDYQSTDRSCDLIREICPTWEIRPSRNPNFADSMAIDNEVMDIEKVLGGWRIALNTTEFLIGNTDHLKDLKELSDPIQYFVGNYVFVDMEDPDKGQTILDRRYPLWKQRYWGYDQFANTGENIGGIMGRMNRSLHNYPVTYTGGRHWGGGGGGTAHPKSFDDLVIFYYGWADASAAGIKRKSQIAAEKGGTGPHIHSAVTFLNMIKDHHRPISKDLRPEIAHIIEHHQRIVAKKALNNNQLEIENKLIQPPPRIVE